MCVTSHRILCFGRRGEPQSLVLMWRGCIAHKNLGGGGVWEYAPSDFYFYYYY